MVDGNTQEELNATSPKPIQTEEPKKRLAGFNDPEVQKKLEAYSKRVERKKQIEETPNIIDLVLKHRQKVGR